MSFTIKIPPGREQHSPNYGGLIQLFSTAKFGILHRHQLTVIVGTMAYQGQLLSVRQTEWIHNYAPIRLPLEVRNSN